MRRETTWVDGRPVRSLTAGESNVSPELVLVPGLGAPGYLVPWARQASAWTRATVLDVPGWRWGRPRACPATLDGIARATARWLEVEDRHDVVLIGHSTGAQAAVRTALLTPERLTGLVLAGPTFDPAARTFGATVRRALATLPREVPGEVPAVLPSYLHSGVVPLLRMLLSALPDAIEAGLAQVRTPVLVLTGQHDGFAPPVWAQRLARVADAPCVIAPGGHNFCFPSPDLADRAVRTQCRKWQVRR